MTLSTTVVLLLYEVKAFDQEGGVSGLQYRLEGRLQTEARDWLVRWLKSGLVKTKIESHCVTVSCRLPPLRQVSVGK